MMNEWERFDQLSGLWWSRGNQLGVLWKDTVESLLTRVKKYGLIKTDNSVRKKKFKEEKNKQENKCEGKKRTVSLQEILAS